MLYLGIDQHARQITISLCTSRVILIQPEERKKRKTDRRDAAALSELLWVNRDRFLAGKPVRGRLGRAEATGLARLGEVLDRLFHVRLIVRISQPSQHGQRSRFDLQRLTTATNHTASGTDQRTIVALFTGQLVQQMLFAFLLAGQRHHVGRQGHHVSVLGFLGRLANPLHFLCQIGIDSSDQQSPSVGLQCAWQLFFRPSLERATLLTDASLYQDALQDIEQLVTLSWKQLATAYRVNDDQDAIDQLAMKRPQAAAMIGDMFIAVRQIQFT